MSSSASGTTWWNGLSRWRPGGAIFGFDGAAGFAGAVFKGYAATGFPSPHAVSVSGLVVIDGGTADGGRGRGFDHLRSGPPVAHPHSPLVRDDEENFDDADDERDDGADDPPDDRHDHEQG